VDIGISDWVVAALCGFITGISKAGLGGVLGGLAVPVMSIWLPPRSDYQAPKCSGMGRSARKYCSSRYFVARAALCAGMSITR
jgi:uncharacterized membrane protein YfcA